MNGVGLNKLLLCGVVASEIVPLRSRMLELMFAPVFSCTVHVDVTHASQSLLAGVKYQMP